MAFPSPSNLQAGVTSRCVLSLTSEMLARPSWDSPWVGLRLSRPRATQSVHSAARVPFTCLQRISLAFRVGPYGVAETLRRDSKRQEQNRPNRRRLMSLMMSSLTLTAPEHRMSPPRPFPLTPHPHPEQPEAMPRHSCGQTLPPYSRSPGIKLAHKAVSPRWKGCVSHTAFKIIQHTR